MLWRQNQHSPSTPPIQDTPTRVPIGKSGVAPSTISPTIWCPGIMRGRIGGRSPSTIWRSVRQTPQAVTLINTSPGRRSGCAKSSIDTQFPEALGLEPNTAALIAIPLTSSLHSESASVLSRISGIGRWPGTHVAVISNPRPRHGNYQARRGVKSLLVQTNLWTNQYPCLLLGMAAANKLAAYIINATIGYLD